MRAPTKPATIPTRAARTTKTATTNGSTGVIGPLLIAAREISQGAIFHGAQKLPQQFHVVKSMIPLVNGRGRDLDPKIEFACYGKQHRIGPLCRLGLISTESRFIRRILGFKNRGTGAGCIP